METFVIIDGNAILHRAFHAIPPLTARNGQVVNAVYGFTTILLRVVRELKPHYVAVAFDAPGKTFRHEEYKEYKATRVKQPQDLYDQFPIVKKVVSGFGFPIFEVSGVEADDTIATVVKKVLEESKKINIIIVTGDMDTLQLVDSRTEVRTMRKGVSDIVIYNEASVRDRFGLVPSQMVDYKSLRGDASDNIKGVPGIGEKTAIELLKKFGTLESLYGAVEKDSGVVKSSVAEKLLTHKKEAFKSKSLVELKNNVNLKFDLELCKVHEPRKDFLIDLFRELDFHSLIKRLSGENFQEKNNADSKIVKKRKSNKQDKKIIQADSLQVYEDVLKKIKQSKKCAYLLAYEGKPRLAILQYFFIAFSANEVYCISAKFLTQALWTLLEEKESTTFDLKSLIEALHANKFVFIPLNCFDTMLADYVLNPGNRNHELTSIVLKQTGLNTIGAQTSLFGVDLDTYGTQTSSLFEVNKRLGEELNEKRLQKVYEDIEMPLVKVLAAIEEAGIQLNVEHVRELSKKIAQKINLVTKKIYKKTGHEFNIASPLQLKEVLFDELEIPVEGIKRGKTGLSTAASELEKMQGQHPIIDDIIEYRELAKLQNTYTDVLPNLVDKRGRLYTTFNQAVTATGRLSSSDPNLQNIPIKTELGREIRKAFEARSGYELIKADYSQIELRIIAGLSHDKEMINIFKHGLDIHRSTAAKINGVSEDEVTFEMRSAAKAVNFGIMYGLGPHGLAQNAHVSFSEAKKFIDRYFEIFKKVKQYLEAAKLLAHKQGYVETFFGRRRYFPEINSSIAQVRSSAERMAVNAPMQGTAADIIKLAMIQMYEFLESKYTREEVTMVLQVHDELLFEVKKNLVKKMIDPIKCIMEGIIKDFEVPITVDIKVGTNWGEME